MQVQHRCRSGGWSLPWAQRLHFQRPLSRYDHAGQSLQSRTDPDPFRAAMRRAKGEAKMRLRPRPHGAAGAGATAAAGAAASPLAAAAAAQVPQARRQCPEALFALFQQHGNAALTFTPSVPSATTILPMTPSSTASNSIVALSVSISAITVARGDCVALLDEPFRQACPPPSLERGRASEVQCGIVFSP